MRNPARPDDVVGTVTEAAPADVEAALEAARDGAAAWAAMSVEDRAQRLRGVADLYEEHAAELFALAAREAGKTWPDCVGEVREACDFARFYASEATAPMCPCGRGPAGRDRLHLALELPARDLLRTDSRCASRRQRGHRQAGGAVAAHRGARDPTHARGRHPAQAAVQLLPGDGATVGAALVADPRIDGVCFTGSTETARLIDRAMAAHLAPDAPLIAETGGLNAMIVDSTALPEQAVRDIVASAFQSAGQRCSALRMSSTSSARSRSGS